MMKSGVILFLTAFLLTGAGTVSKSSAAEAKKSVFELASLSDIYSEAPDFDNCKAGVLTTAEKQRVLDYINQIRAIHGQLPVTYEESGNVDAQNAALIMASNYMLSHQPESSVLCYSQSGYNGAETSNLHLGGSSGGDLADSKDMVTGWMKDNNSAIAQDRVGHRRAIINPFLKSIAFGRSEGVPKTGQVPYATAGALKYQDYVENTGHVDVEYVAYPVNNYPPTLIDRNFFLSFSAIMDKNNLWANQNVDFSQATVKVTSESGANVPVSEVCFDNEGWGSLPNALKWKAAGLQDEVKYTVEIKNVRYEGSSKDYTYWFKLTSNTTGVAPGPTTLTNPADNATGVELKGLLTWNAVIYAKTYTVEVDDNSDFSSPALSKKGVSGTALTLEGLKPETKYWWRVKAVNEYGESAWSATRAFTTSAPAPEAPQLAAPINNETNVILLPKFVWNKDPKAYSYALQVSKSDEFSNYAIFQSLISDTNYVATTALEPNVKYFWRVRSNGDGGNSEWSEVRAFTTRAKTPAPGKITLVLPADNETNTSITPVLSWQADPNAETYELAVADNTAFSGFSTIINEKALTSTTYAVPADKLYNETKYYWKVRASGGGETGPWSSVRSFTTGDASVYEGYERTLSSKYSAYPNPATEKINLSFKLVTSSFAKLEVYSVNGTMVMSRSGVFAQGDYNIEIMVNNLPSGSYSFRVTAGGESLGGQFNVAR